MQDVEPLIPLGPRTDDTVEVNLVMTVWDGQSQELSAEVTFAARSGREASVAAYQWADRLRADVEDAVDGIYRRRGQTETA